jgi:hypothetical protein
MYSTIGNSDFVPELRAWDISYYSNKVTDHWRWRWCWHWHRQKHAHATWDISRAGALLTT